MTRRIPKRRYGLGSGELSDPEAIEALEARQLRHARLTAAKPSESFAELLERKQSQGQSAPERPVQPQGGRDPLLGLSPNQDPSLANRPSGKRSGRVILKG